ncbi:UDP-3-O-acylglucosamine N-acyltransferase [uncultured Eubacterium sp.]|nr:UDP-3-O-acylglucosamine N-acyltransferase [uncultured Eubacterium sp.]
MCSFLIDRKYERNIAESVCLLLVTETCRELQEHYNLCIVENPRLAFFMVHNHLAASKEYARPSFKSIIDTTAKISPLASIAKNNVEIGKNVIIEEFVSIKENTVIGDCSIIRAGTIVGGEGFEQKRTEGVVLSVKHAGGVVIGSEVELQQNNTVDKAIYPWDDTIIGNYCKTDNIVHIAHGMKMGERVFVAAHTCIAGRVTMGNDVWIGPGVTLINGIHVGDNARVNIGSVTTRDVAENKSVTGNFAIDHSVFIGNLKVLRNGIK